MEMMSGMKEKLVYKSNFFTNHKDAVHIEDDYVQKMIDENVDRLLKSKREGSDFSFSATGDTLVAGVKWEDDESIDIIVAQNYSQACLLKNKYGSYDPVDWREDNEDCDDIRFQSMDIYELLAEKENLKNLLTKVEKYIDNNR